MCKCSNSSFCTLSPFLKIYLFPGQIYLIGDLYIGWCDTVGALTGLAIGDAMGAPFEGSPPPLRPVTEMHGDGPRMRKAGCYTDDTLQAIAVAESLIHCRDFCQNDLMQRLINGYSRFPEFYGPTSRAVFDLVQSGIPPDRAAGITHLQRGGSRSNGSVMRGAPVGIFFPDHRCAR